MIEIGQIFYRDGYSLCVVDILDYNLRKYALVAIEREKVEYKFYEIIYDGIAYQLQQVSDKIIEHALFEIVESSEV